MFSGSKPKLKRIKTMSYDPDDRRHLAQQINRETAASRYHKKEGCAGLGDPPTPVGAAETHTLVFSGLPKCTPLHFKTLLAEALKLKQAETEKIAQEYWGARGAQYSVKILSAALNFTIETKGETQ